ncbi:MULTISPECIES: hypothetical protein [unclassified Sphingobium]|uniref:hypothetical protein n=1 Tax=unclassified Sphingobium TaxID=2611147 RepID=UPI0035A68AEB
MTDRTKGAIPSLDCTTPIDALLELTAGVGRQEAMIDNSVLTTTPQWGSQQFDWPPLFNQIAHGSIAHLMPDKVYAYTTVGQAEDVPELGALSTLYGAFIVGPRMKKVIDAFDIPKSELFPVGMVLRDCDVRDRPHGDDPERLGGGAVVEGQHWLWHIYNRYDLVDWEKSEKKPYWVEDPRGDLPGSPMQRFSYVNNKEKSSLRALPYQESAAFQLLGNRFVFISPEFAHAMDKAGVLWSLSGGRYASALIGFYFLDKPRYIACRIARRQKQIVTMPKINIAGTDIAVTNIHDPPSRWAGT